MKKKTVWSLLLALAMTVTAIGASTAAFAAAPNQAEPQTLIATENEDAIWDQIEALEEKSDAVFQRNEALWDKVDEACYALPDDYDFENFDEAAFIRASSHTIYHPVGTCRMGSDASAVVDPALRVRGVDRLWVADASVMPSVPRGHPNAVVAAIADRGAGLILAA